MKKGYDIRRPGHALAVLAFILIASSMAHAQATRTGYIGGMFDRVRAENGTSGIIAKNGAYITIRDSVISNNVTVGVAIQSPANTAGLNLEGVVVFNSATGIAAGGAGTKVDLSNTSILNNNTGVSSLGGTVNSHTNNRFGNNSSDGVALVEVGEK
jgi:hypothetical protein